MSLILPSDIRPGVKAWINCIPPKTTGQAAARILKRKDGTMFVGKFASGKGKAAQDDLMSLLMPHRPPQPMQGPVECHIVIRWPWRASEPKRNRGGLPRPCDKRPDVDNLVKMLLDCMTRLAYWTDDGQVARLCISKEWGDGPGLYIEAREMTG
jgi:Holliday junction resolvase RusA-like endonuclease